MFLFWFCLVLICWNKKENWFRFYASSLFTFMFSGYLLGASKPYYVLALLALIDPQVIFQVKHNQSTSIFLTLGIIWYMSVDIALARSPHHPPKKPTKKICLTLFFITFLFHFSHLLVINKFSSLQRQFPPDFLFPLSFLSSLHAWQAQFVFPTFLRECPSCLWECL